MIKKEFRLSKRCEIEEVKNKGRVFQTPLFGVIVLKKDDGIFKTGWVVSKKISTRAVDRNRIKRLLAESINNNWNLVDKSGYRLWFLTKRSLLDQKQGTVENEVVGVLKTIMAK